MKGDLHGIGPRCPYCRERTTHPQGARLYLCQNPECPGARDEQAQFISILCVDAKQGAHLRPWRHAFDFDRIRRVNPRALAIQAA